MPRLLSVAAAVILCVAPAAAQEPARLDSLYIAEVEGGEGPVKLLHAEPLYIDLIRDLGARKGEKEWNLGFGLVDKLTADVYELLVEYEWAPVNRLGLEIEVPVLLASGSGIEPGRPLSQVEGLKTAAQWTAIVSPRHQTSIALGYLNTLLFREPGSDGAFVAGNRFNPFVVAARRFGQNWHGLVYTGPIAERRGGRTAWAFEANTNVHYMIPGTRNFVGLELNHAWEGGDYDLVIRPQMRVGLADNLLVGLAPGIPVSKSKERLGIFVRLIWEPGHRHAH
jgi:hypothetical protein